VEEEGGTRVFAITLFELEEVDDRGESPVIGIAGSMGGDRGRYEIEEI